MTRKDRLAVSGACALICLICIAVGIQKHYSVAITDAWQRGYEVGLEVERLIPTIEQLQQALIDTGVKRYDVGPKGVDGDPGTDTLTAWKNYSFDQYAGYMGELK